MNDYWTAGIITWIALCGLTVAILLSQEHRRRMRAREALANLRMITMQGAAVEQRDDRQPAVLEEGSPDRILPIETETTSPPPAPHPSEATTCMVCGRILRGRRSVARRLGRTCAGHLKKQQEKEHAERSSSDL